MGLVLMEGVIIVVILILIIWLFIYLFLTHKKRRHEESVKFGSRIDPDQKFTPEELETIREQAELQKNFSKDGY